MLRQFTSSCSLLFYIRFYLQTFSSFVETVAVPQLDLRYSPGVCQQAASHGFLCCQLKWNVMSCQENCEAISMLSGVWSVTFGVAGSWCLPGALGTNWDLSAWWAAEAPVAFFHSVSLTSSFVLGSPFVSLTPCCCFVLWIPLLFPNLHLVLTCYLDFLSKWETNTLKFMSKCRVHQLDYIWRWSGFYWISVGCKCNLHGLATFWRNSSKFWVNTPFVFLPKSTLLCLHTEYEVQARWWFISLT